MNNNNLIVQFHCLFEAVQCCDNVKYVGTYQFVCSYTNVLSPVDYYVL